MTIAIFATVKITRIPIARFPFLNVMVITIISIIIAGFTGTAIKFDIDFLAPLNFLASVNYLASVKFLVLQQDQMTLTLN